MMYQLGILIKTNMLRSTYVKTLLWIPANMADVSVIIFKKNITKVYNKPCDEIHSLAFLIDDAHYGLISKQFKIFP